MANAINQKLKLLYIMDILQTETDENHSLNTQEIIERLKKRDISAERKSIYSDIAVLREYGMDIELSRERGGGYYLATREFELPELKLLVDAVSASKFITEKKSRELIKKISTLSSKEEAKQLSRQMVAARRSKTENESIYYITDVIYTCINNNHKLEFQYMDWTIRKTKTLRKDGKIYVVSPCFLLWFDENYYLVAYEDEADDIRYYRVDKMKNATETDRIRSGSEKRNALKKSDFAKETIGMFDGREEMVAIQTRPSMVGIFLDRFGRDISVRQLNEDTIEVRWKVKVSKQFFGWLTGLGEDVTISHPETVREEYTKYLQRIMENY